MTTIATLAGAQDPAPGIPRELARQRRAQLSSVHYELSFELAKRQEFTAGKARVHFSFADDRAPDTVILDFDGDLDALLVNEIPQERGYRIVHNHIVITSGNLVPGANTIDVAFRTKVAATGTPLTVFREPAGDAEYLYTLVVPADAHRLFPCFDQPDLKATCSLRLQVPTGWTAVANGTEKEPPETTPDGDLLFVFEQTKPLSTYLIAFAAGPFDVIDRGARGDATPMRMLVRPSKRGDLEPDLLFTMHERALGWLGDYFDYPYPFGKLDIVLLPGLPYGGMEHAGAIFYRESALAFDHEPTASERVRRSTLIYHEVSHQWFGNLVTMEWFDDLWLKEGFATFVGYHLLDALEPKQNAWLRFHQQVKPTAYRIDATPGTTPIYQELGNLADAKSAYGAIVYNKAPAVLRELHGRLGAEAFRNGVRSFLKEHEYGNARWQALVAAFERAARTDLGTWSDRWILAPGMPRVRARWQVGPDGKLTDFAVVQQSVQGDDGLWPLRVEALLIDGPGESRVRPVESATAEARCDDLVGSKAPRCVLLNAADVSYGQFLLDPRSQDYLLEQLINEQDVLRRAIALSALFDTVREGELAPVRYAELVLQLLEKERDAQTQLWLLGTLSTTLRRYLHDEDRASLTGRITALLLAQLRAGTPGLELQTFRFLIRASDADPVLQLCDDLLAGKKPIDGLALGQQDRYSALAALLAAGRGEDHGSRMLGAATPAGAAKYAFIASAAVPDAATKKRYFEVYLQPDEPPEQWMQQSLDTFHWPGQKSLTLPYLRRALDQLEWVKQHRKIFYMPAWIAGFLGGHASREALETVEQFLAERKDLPGDIRLKVLQSLDGLRRAVLIKEKY